MRFLHRRNSVIHACITEFWQNSLLSLACAQFPVFERILNTSLNVYLVQTKKLPKGSLLMAERVRFSRRSALTKTFGFSCTFLKT